MFFRLTPTVRNLVFINVAIFLVSAIFSRFLITERMALWKPATELFQPYQLFSYMFAHGGFAHIFFNMMSLSILGPYLESVWGHKRFLTFYIITGIGAAIIYLLLENFLSLGGGGWMVGASGAIYGLSMAFGLLYPEVELYFYFFPIKAKYFVFVSGFLAYVMDPSGQIAHFAHLGGAIVGFVLIKFGRF